MTVDGVDEVKKSIVDIYDRRKAAILAMSKYYAAKMLVWFRQQQVADKWWNNQTFDAIARVFTNGYLTDGGESIAMGAAHGVQYGVYLELANDGKHSAIWPMMIEWSAKYLEAAKALIERTAEDD
jgi:hypothetical protein